MLILCFTYQHHNVYKRISGNTASYLVQPSTLKNRYLLQKEKKFYVSLNYQKHRGNT
jgi:hypothetical protein